VRAQFKIRTHCLSVAKAKRQLQLRQGEIDPLHGGRKSLCRGFFFLSILFHCDKIGF